VPSGRAALPGRLCPSAVLCRYEVFSMQHPCICLAKPRQPWQAGVGSLSAHSCGVNCDHNQLKWLSQSTSRDFGAASVDLVPCSRGTA
jgi:hypothetical protein